MTNYRMFKAVFGLSISIGLSACASKGINLVKSGAVSVSTADSEQVKIVNVYVKQMEHEVLIHADVKPAKRVRFFHPGHLIFNMTTADNQEFFNLDITRYTREHNDSNLSVLKHVSFWIRMPVKIPNGAKLAVSHHGSNEHENKMK